MKTRIIVGVICVPLLFLFLVLLPAAATGVAIGGISAISVWELRRALSIERRQIDVLYGILAFMYPLLVSLGADGKIISAVSYIALVAIFYEFMHLYERGQNTSIANLFGTIFAAIVLPIALSSVVRLRVYGGNLGRGYVLAPFVAAFLTDAGAYFFGVFFGKRKAFPRVSPKKTVAGCVGGFVIGIGGMYLYWLVMSLAYDGLPFPIIKLFILGIIGAAATMFGDLAFSLVKRIAGIKDYGNLLPGHGGMMDRFDSLVFAGPAVCLIITSIFPAGL